MAPPPTQQANLHFSASTSRDGIIATVPIAHILTMDEALHDLGGIRVDPPRRPLGLDRIFERAQRWKQGAPSAPVRTPSPPPSAVRLALPAPLRDGAAESPLGELFAYPDLVPLVLEHLRRPGELATAARVSRDWQRIATKTLYRDIWVRPCEWACGVGEEAGY